MCIWDLRSSVVLRGLGR